MGARRMIPKTRHARCAAPAGTTLAVMLLALTAVTAGCGSSGGGGTPVELCIDFTPTVAQPTAGSVTARMSAESGCELVEVEVVATDVSDVFAFESVIEYDPDVAAFLGFSLVDSVLESDGADVTVIAEEAVFGEVTLGATRIASTGINVSGTQVLIRLAFARFGVTGAGPLRLDTNCLVNSATPPQTIDSVTCSGGTLTIR